MNKLFKIFELDPVQAEKIKDSTNEPHRHTFEELL